MTLQTQIYKNETRNFKRCPNCQSFYLTDTECESCGFQLDFDRMGKPFDERSFYNYKDDYWECQPFYVKLMNSLENKNSELCGIYRKQLNHRFDDFMKFVAKWYVGDEHTPHYLFELSDLIKEMVIYNVPTRYISESLQKKKLDHLFNELLMDLDIEKLDKKVTLKKVLNYRLFGVLTVKFVALMTYGVGFVCFFYF